MRVMLLVVLAACGSSPSNVAGDYTVALTNRDNPCMIASWTVGQMTSGIDVQITQDGSSATALVGGAAAIALDALLANHSFSGDVDGAGIALVSHGTRPQTMGNCTYTFNAEIDGSLTNNALSGQVVYSAADNGNPDCTTIHGCQSIQDFSGSRPPP